MESMLDDFERSVDKEKEKYRKDKYNRPKYIIINKNTLINIKDKLYKIKMYGLVERITYKELYIAIDNNLDDYDFVILG